MRIGIQTWGSEGDIRPFIALGHALTVRGHQVEMLYTEIGERRYDAVAEALGFSARAVASPVVADTETTHEIGLEAINARDQLQQALIIFKRLLEPVIPQMYDAGLDLARRSDLLVHHFILHAARAAADISATPAITVAFAHMMSESRYIHPHGLPRLGEWGNVIEWKLARLAMNQTLLKAVNRFRKQVGLPLFRDLLNEGWPSHRLHLIASSPALLDPRPAGTTHTTLKAGVPSVPIPHVSDQFAWSDDLHRLGVAPKPLKRTKLTAEALAGRIRETVGNQRMKVAAESIQRRMATDDGPRTAAQMIDTVMGWNKN